MRTDPQLNHPVFRRMRPAFSSKFYEYLIALVIVLLAVSVNLIIADAIGYRSVALLLLATVLISALFLGRGPMLLAAGTSALAWNFLFIPPRFTLTISSVEDSLLFAMYFTIALITGILTSRVRSQERAVRLREENTAALYEFSRTIANAITFDQILSEAVSHIERVLTAHVMILLPDAQGDLMLRYPETDSLNLFTEAVAQNAAKWAYTNGKPAGQHTATFSASPVKYYPLRTSSGVIGVIGVHLPDEMVLAVDKVALLETFCSQFALAIERAQLDEKAKHSALVEESERLYKTLLDSISHELRTPMATISGATSGLQDPRIMENVEARQLLFQDIQDATERLNRLVSNMLDMTRLQSGHLQLNLEWCDIADLISVSVKRLQKQLVDHPAQITLAPDLPLVRIDFVLIEQTLVNLLHNAIVYTPANTRISIRADVESNMQSSQLVLMVEDNGPGLPPAALEKVFDKFYRVPGTATGGTGLGLSIARGLVEAHNGTISAENVDSGGARFTLRLPLAQSPQLPPLSDDAMA